MNERESSKLNKLQSIDPTQILKDNTEKKDADNESDRTGPLDDSWTTKNPEDQGIIDKAREILKHMPKKNLLKTLPPENQRPFYRHQKK